MALVKPGENFKPRGSTSQHGTNLNFKAPSYTGRESKPAPQDPEEKKSKGKGKK